MKCKQDGACNGSCGIKEQYYYRYSTIIRAWRTERYLSRVRIDTSECESTEPARTQRRTSAIVAWIYAQYDLRCDATASSSGSWISFENARNCHVRDSDQSLRGGHPELPPMNETNPAHAGDRKYFSQCKSAALGVVTDG